MSTNGDMNSPPERESTRQGAPDKAALKEKPLRGKTSDEGLEDGFAVIEAMSIRRFYPTFQELEIDSGDAISDVPCLSSTANTTPEFPVLAAHFLDLNSDELDKWRPIFDGPILITDYPDFQDEFPSMNSAMASLDDDFSMNPSPSEHKVPVVVRRRDPSISLFDNVYSNLSVQESVTTSREAQSNNSSVINPISQGDNSTCTETSAGFETDSTCSEEESDFEDDDVLSTSDPQSFLGVNLNKFLDKTTQNSNLTIRPLLGPMKQALVDGIMKEFWIIFDQEWSSNIWKHTEQSPRSATSSISQSKNNSGKVNSNKWQKRGREDDEDDNPEDNEERDPKRPKADSFPVEGADDKMKFACPYHKHNPRKYCHQTRRWRSCALTPLDSVSRVKGHLYRHHRLFQCSRCKELFANQDELEKHFVAITGCELNLGPTAEGITSNIEKQLRSRKKSHRGQSEKDRWEEIYRLLFPMEEVPSPYIEPFQEHIIQSPDSEQLTQYEEFSRRELPRFFRSALEAAIAEEAQPIEERLRSQLVGMIQDCQDRVFSSYRSRLTADASSPSHALGTTPRKASQFPLQVDQLNRNAPEESPKGIIETFYERAPPQTLFDSHPEVISASISSTVPIQNATSDSGYVSEPLAEASKFPDSECTSQFETTTNSSSQNEEFPERLQSIEKASAEMTSCPSFSIDGKIAQHDQAYNFGDMPSPSLMPDFYPYDAGLYPGLDSLDFDTWDSW